MSTETSGTKANKEEATVSVRESVMAEILARLDRKDKEIERLTAAADVSKLAKYDTAHEIKVPTVVRLNVLEDKVVAFWDPMPINKVVKDPRLGWLEDLRVHMVFFPEPEDKRELRPFIEIHSPMAQKMKRQEYGYFDAWSAAQKVDAEIEQRTVTKEGITILQVRRLDNGQRYEIDSRFIN